MIGGLCMVIKQLTILVECFQPKVLTAENGWRRVWNRAHWDDNNAPQYIERNMLTGEERPYEERG